MTKADIDLIEQLQHESARNQASRTHHKKKREEAEVRLAALERENERLREAWGYAQPIIEQLAEWERRNGSAVAIQVIEQPGLCSAVSRGCLLGGRPRAALTALSTAKQETSDAD